MIGFPLEVGAIRLNDIFLILMGIICSVLAASKRARSFVYSDYIQVGLAVYLILGIILGMTGCKYWPNSLVQLALSSIIMTSVITIYNARDIVARFINKEKNRTSISNAITFVIGIYMLTAIHQLITKDFTGDYLYATPFYDDASVASACTIVLLNIIYIGLSTKAKTKCIKSCRAKEHSRLKVKCFAVSSISFGLVILTLSRSAASAYVIAALLTYTIYIVNKKSFGIRLKARKSTYIKLIFAVLAISIASISTFKLLGIGEVLQSGVNIQKTGLIEVSINRILNFAEGFSTRDAVHSNELSRLGDDIYLYGAGFGCYEYHLKSFFRVLHGTHTRILISSGLIGLIIFTATYIITLLTTLKAYVNTRNPKKLIAVCAGIFLLAFSYGYDIFGINPTLVILLTMGVLKENNSNDVELI